MADAALRPLGGACARIVSFADHTLQCWMQRRPRQAGTRRSRS
jgi:hypothetical protein